MEEHVEVHDAVCEAILFKNEENGYTVAIFSDTSSNTSFTATGIMPFLECGDRISLYGKWTVHNTYGRQFQVSKFLHIVMHSEEEIVTYLSSGIILGIGPALAGRIVDRFGKETLTVMRDEPKRVAQIKGITLKRAKAASLQLIEKSDFQELSILLSSFGIGMARVAAIYRKYGSSSLQIVQSNPYRLADEMNGIGFRTADILAAHFGCDPDSSFRIGSALIYCMSQMQNDGNTYIYQETLFEHARRLLYSDRDDVEEARGTAGDVAHKNARCMDMSRTIDVSHPGYQELILKKRIIAYRITQDNQIEILSERYAGADVRIAFSSTLEAEIYVAKSISARTKRTIPDISLHGLREEMEEICKRIMIDPDDTQVSAVVSAAVAPFSIITGGPGTGKTTIIRLLVSYFTEKKRKVVLCAPTGRAAKRMYEASLQKASTIHRLLEIERVQEHEQETIFKRNHDNPIDADIIIVDETSMLDIFLFRSFLDAVNEDTQVVFVGDQDQLPSVGPGNVLADMIASKTVSVCRLTKIFRQAAISRIVQNAHRILLGESLVFDQSLESDCMLIARDYSEGISQAVCKLYANVLPEVYQIDVLRDAVVLCPSRKGPAGIIALNEILQSTVISADAPHVYAHGCHFHVADKVMQIRNNYDLSFTGSDNAHGTGVFNGEMGVIKEINPSEGLVTVELDDTRLVTYDKSSLDDLDLAYATTVHKSQGSEFPIVILAVPAGSSVLNNRNLLYTAVTRAKTRLFIVADRKTLEKMVRTSHQSRRLTSLCAFLQMYGKYGGD